LRTVCWGRYLG